MGFFEDAGSWAEDRIHDVGHSLTHSTDWQIGGDIGKTWQQWTGFLRAPDAPPQDAGAPPNPLIASNNAAAQTQQRQAGGMWNILTGGQGVLDSTPGQSPRLLGY